LTPDEERRTLDVMPGKQTASAKTKAAADPLAAAVNAFAEVRPPKLPITSLDQVTPENAGEVLEALAAYMDQAGEAVVGVVRLLLSGLSGKSFSDLEATKDFAARVQDLLARSRPAVRCASCGEVGRYEATSHHSSRAGALRIRHGSKSSHGGSTVVTELDVRKLK
jgi:hypothetical protein